MTDSWTPRSTSDPLSPASPASLTSSLLRARPYRFATLAATVDNPDPGHKDQYGSSSVPIYQTATFKGMGGQYDYSRSGNPTRSHLEHHIAKISNARHAFAVTSGMGALDVIFRLLKPGDEIIAGNDLYGGSNRLIGYLKEHGGITTHHVDTTNPESLLPYLQDPAHKVAMVLLESPTNPLLQIADLEEIARITKRYRPEAIVVVDNTMMSPYLCRPLELGCDIVYDSGTKYLSGHHDLMAGLICCDRDEIAKGIGFTINSIGNGLSPFDSFLLLRGVKTLSLRIDKQQANTILIANYLDQLGFKVNYPGLASHRGKAVHDRIASGPGAVLSFETGDVALSERIVASTRLWGISVSFGCINSLISMPCLMSHASIDPAVRAARNLPEDLIRLCVGIEDPADLIDDLEAALLEAGAVRTVDEASSALRGERLSLERTGAVRGDGLVRELEGLGLKSEEGRSDQPKVETIMTSAPGKVILFGEHAVVHGVTAIAYRRAISGRQEQSLKSLKGFDEIPFLITDTKVPRDTKTLVAGVARRKLEEPDTIIPLLDSIQRIADQAESLLASATTSSGSSTTRLEQLSDLARLIEQNHSHLVSLGVSHPALETVRNKTRDQPWGLATKLTGAGGGGCAVTVVPDGFSNDSLLSLRSALADIGFETYSTSVGGRGYGVLVPPAAGSAEEQVESAEGGVEANAIPGRKRFEDAPAEDLARWAESAGVWTCA